MKKLLLLLSLLACAVAWGQAVVLRSGDQLDVRIGGVPPEEVNQVSSAYTVDEQGYVNMPHIGLIKAAGLTQSQLQQSIESTYKSQQIYTNPTITVSVPQTARFVDVGGAVKSPQRVAYTPDLTVLGAINAAGGFTEFANQSKVRWISGNSAVDVNIKESRQNPSKDPAVKPGDKIEVQQSFW